MLNPAVVSKGKKAGDTPPWLGGRPSFALLFFSLLTLASGWPLYAGAELQLPASHRAGAGVVGEAGHAGGGGRSVLHLIDTVLCEFSKLIGWCSCRKELSLEMEEQRRSVGWVESLLPETASG